MEADGEKFEWKLHFRWYSGHNDFFFILQIKDCIFPETIEDNLIHVAGHFNSVLTACKPCSP